jgi:hypothetical protein
MAVSPFPPDSMKTLRVLMTPGIIDASQEEWLPPKAERILAEMPCQDPQSEAEKFSPSPFMKDFMHRVSDQGPRKDFK